MAFPLIANLEIAITVLLSVVVGILIFTAPGMEAVVKWVLFIVLVFTLCIPIGFSTKDLTGAVVICIGAVAWYILISFLSVLSVDFVGITGYFNAVLVCGCVSGVLAIAVGVYTAVNMDEVVSLRMLYVNSNVQMFEKTLVYSLNRTFVAFSYFSWAAFWLVLYCVVRGGDAPELLRFLDMLYA